MIKLDMNLIIACARLLLWCVKTIFVAYEYVNMAFGKSICQFPLDYHAGKVSVY